MKIKTMKLAKVEKVKLAKYSRILFWFLTGAFLTLFIFSGFYYFSLKTAYRHRVYPGVISGNYDLSKKNEQDIKGLFQDKNNSIGDITFIFNYGDESATVSARDIDLGYDQDLIAAQALSVGRSSDPISNLSIIFQAGQNGIILPTSYKFSESSLVKLLTPIASKIEKDPVDAQFNFENGKVTTFKPSSPGVAIDYETLNSILKSKAPGLLSSKNKLQLVSLEIPTKTIDPKITTNQANNLGIKELIGTGTSLFEGSIDSRIFNVNLAATRVNGVLVKPGETFSFDQALGDVSSLTGYKQAYVIENGRTVLGDGGGVCQVSTTLFRAILDAGLPVVERNAHAYRVHYYEEDSPPGIDATIYYPSVDLKFKNDTGNYILIQSVIDLNTLRLTYNLYGQSDGRISTISQPIITSQTPPPDPKYEDDPTLPTGTIKQVDFAAWGANVYFTREVKKDGKVVISEKFTSNYRPWQAVYLRGTAPQ